MSKYAIIENGAVSNLVEADDAFALSQGWVVAGDNVAIGDLYIDGQFFKTVATGAEKTVTPIRFKLLFTFAELVAIYNAMQSDPILQQAYKILDDPRLTEVNLSSSPVVGMIDYLIAQSLILPERKAQILEGILP